MPSWFIWECRGEPASHAVPACGFAVQGRDGWWVYTGDTGPNAALWRRLREMKVTDLVIETAFGDDERELAQTSRHLCPATLGSELAALCGPLNGGVNVHITHIKPGEIEAVMSEIGRLPTPHKILALAAGQVMKLDDAGDRATGDVTGMVDSHASGAAAGPLR